MAALEYAAFLARMRERHGADLEVVMRTYTEKPRTEVDWKGFAYDPFLDGSSRISVGLVATRMLMAEITALGVPVAAEPLNALTPQYVDGLVTYTASVHATSPTRPPASGCRASPRWSGSRTRAEGSIDVAVSAVISARSGHDFLGVDRHGVSRAVGNTGNDTGHVILRGDADGPNYSPAHIADTKRRLAARGLPEVLVVDASHGNSGKDHVRQVQVVRDLAGRSPGASRASAASWWRATWSPAGRTRPHRPGSLTYGQSVTDSCVDLATTEGAASRDGRRHHPSPPRG